jgi:hypothetical protein
MLPTASGRWILVYEGANTVSEQTFRSLQSLFYGVDYAAAPGCRRTPKKEPVAIRGYTLDARSCQACYLLAGSLRCVALPIPNLPDASSDELGWLFLVCKQPLHLDKHERLMRVDDGHPYVL